MENCCQTLCHALSCLGVDWLWLRISIVTFELVLQQVTITALSLPVSYQSWQGLSKEQGHGEELCLSRKDP